VITVSDSSALSVSWSLKLPENARRFVWMQLVLPESRKVITHGLLGPGAAGVVAREQWRVLLEGKDHSTRNSFLLLYDQAQAGWTGRHPPEDDTYVLGVYSLPEVQIRARRDKDEKQSAARTVREGG